MINNLYLSTQAPPSVVWNALEVHNQGAYWEVRVCWVDSDPVWGPGIWWGGPSVRYVLHLSLFCSSHSSLKCNLDLEGFGGLLAELWPCMGTFWAAGCTCGAGQKQGVDWQHRASWPECSHPRRQERLPRSGTLPPDLESSWPPHPDTGPSCSPDVGPPGFLNSPQLLLGIVDKASWHFIISYFTSSLYHVTVTLPCPFNTK